mmetsp:Transcript_15884/g.28206  ORF Transcript_15884/g.28206 Transcript_15884/m.28206 type:complete len:208 (-) Transcript_15884:258-881(-)
MFSTSGSDSASHGGSSSSLIKSRTTNPGCVYPPKSCSPTSSSSFPSWVSTLACSSCSASVSSSVLESSLSSSTSSLQSTRSSRSGALTSTTSTPPTSRSASATCVVTLTSQRRVWTRASRTTRHTRSGGRKTQRSMSTRISSTPKSGVSKMARNRRAMRQWAAVYPPSPRLSLPCSSLEGGYGWRGKGQYMQQRCLCVCEGASQAAE